MKTRRFTVSSPDADGDMSPDIDLEVENRTGKTVRLLRTNTVYLNKSGDIVAASGRSEHDVKLDAGERMTVPAGGGWLKTRYFGPSGEPVAARVFVIGFTREFMKLGEVAVPAKANTVAFLRTTVQSAMVQEQVSVSVTMSAPDDEGAVNIELRCGLVNISSTHIARAQLKVDLLDEEDSPVDTSITEAEIPAGFCELLEAGFYLKKSQVRNTHIKMTLAVYAAAFAETCEAGVARPAPDGDQDAGEDEGGVELAFDDVDDGDD